MTTPLFLLRSKEIGLSLDELKVLTVGVIFDMFTEKSNDSAEYLQVATQEDFDRF